MNPFAPTLALLLLALTPPAPAQEPATAGKPEPQAKQARLEMIPLPALLREAVYHVQPLAGGASAEAAASKADPGTTHARKVARIRDIVFDAEGVLQQLHVDKIDKSTDEAVAGTAAPLVLAATAVKWDPDRRMLVTSLDATQIAALPMFGEAEAAKAKQSNRLPVHAKELLAAKVRIGAVPVTEPVRAFWYAPAAGRIAFATLPIAGGARLLPWSIVRPTGGGEALTLQLTAAKEQIEGAPLAPEEQKPPDAMQRLLSYRHFQAAIPAWEERQVKETTNGSGQRR
jgi:hypothetical protein